MQHMALVSAIRFSLSTLIRKREQRVAFAVNVDVLSVEALCTAQCWAAQIRRVVRLILKNASAYFKETKNVSTFP